MGKKTFFLVFTLLLIAAVTVASEIFPAYALAASDQMRRPLRIIDIVFIVFAIYMIRRIIRSRKIQNDHRKEKDFNLKDNAENNPEDHSQEATREQRIKREADAFWGAMSGQDASGSTAESYAGSHSVQDGVRLPQNFDLEDFMAGAKALFTRVQESWGRRDLEDISQFTTEEMQGTFELRATDSPEPKSIDILLINHAEVVEAELDDFQSGSGRKYKEEYITVYFDVLLREGTGSNKQAQENWRFTRESGSTWKLDRIYPANAN